MKLQVLKKDVLPKVQNRKFSRSLSQLVIPSIPGFGFSDAPTRPGLGSVELAHICLRLMQRLGYEKFFLLTEGFGGLIANDMSIMYHKQ